MRKYLVGILILAIWAFAISAFGPSAVTTYADNGVSTGNRTFTLFSALSTTTLEVTSTAAVFDNPMNNITCDFVSTNLTATGIWVVEYNAGSSYTSFTSGNGWSTIKAAGAVTTLSQIGKPVRVIRSRYTLASAAANTNVITVNCAGVQ